MWRGGYAGVVPNCRQRLEDDHATKQFPERTVSAAAARRYSDFDARTTSSRPGYPSGRMVKHEHSDVNCADLPDLRLMHGTDRCWAERGSRTRAETEWSIETCTEVVNAS